MLPPVLRLRRYVCACVLALGLTGLAVGRAESVFTRGNLHSGLCAQDNYQNSPHNGGLDGAKIAWAGYGTVT